MFPESVELICRYGILILIFSSKLVSFESPLHQQPERQPQLTSTLKQRMEHEFVL